MEILSCFAQLLLKLIPILIVAVFLAELARLWLGEERLKQLIVGKRPWEGRLRAAALGAILPFCECGAFPVMIGLLQAGIPLKIALTFFIISPIVSIPAFLFLLGIFGFRIAIFYILMTVTLGLIISSLLTSYGNTEALIKRKFAGNPRGCGCRGDKTGTTTCCPGTGEEKQSIFLTAWFEGFNTIKKVLPYALGAIFVAALLKTYISPDLFERVFTMTAPFNVPAAAAAGIPIYGGDCTKITMVAPFLEITRAVGPGIAFILAGAGTSINGLIFMNSIFNRKFLALFVLSIFTSAIIVGYTLGSLF